MSLSNTSCVDDPQTFVELARREGRYIRIEVLGEFGKPVGRVFAFKVSESLALVVDQHVPEWIQSKHQIRTGAVVKFRSDGSNPHMASYQAISGPAYFEKSAGARVRRPK